MWRLRCLVRDTSGAGRACGLRAQLDERATTEKRQGQLTLEPYQMMIQLEAWNLRERDDWGKMARLRRAGREPERRHWVYTGTCFRLDHRGQTAGGRPVITERGFVATRPGVDALREQLHAEALGHGLGQAVGALVIGDGAVWLWRLAQRPLAPPLPPHRLQPCKKLRCALRGGSRRGQRSLGRRSARHPGRGDSRRGSRASLGQSRDSRRSRHGEKAGRRKAAPAAGAGPLGTSWNQGKEPGSRKAGISPSTRGQGKPGGCPGLGLGQTPEAAHQNAGKEPPR